jgi:predicted dehydrogenase
MKRITRRQVLENGMIGGLLAGLPVPGVFGAQRSEAVGPNEEVRIAVIGLGSIDAVGGVGARGYQLIDRFSVIPGARVVALCDPDEAILGHCRKTKFPRGGESVAAHRDLRRVLDDPQIDAVVIAAPNHWHALATTWGCQAGKDVYVEKPFSHNLWEGRQMVAATRKYRRIVQVGTQRRSSASLRAAFEYLQSGALGAIRLAHAVVYRPRQGIGSVTSPTPIPSSVDYDLWCGPAPKLPLMRKQLHYEWHWFWPYGNGEIGNNGVHLIDVARWGLGQDRPPLRARSIGGRFGFHDAGKTPNTQIAILEYHPAPLLCEVRNLRVGSAAIGSHRDISRGLIIDCEGGYFAGDGFGGSVFDRSGKMIKDMRGEQTPGEQEVAHVANFVSAVRSRNAQDLNAEAREGHLSAICVHMANTSHRLGSTHPPEVIAERTPSPEPFSDAFARCRTYLSAHGIDLDETQAVLGPWVTLDPRREHFTGEFRDQANALSRRTYRKPYVVPELV